MRANAVGSGGLTLAQIAAHLGGRVCGDPDVPVTQVGSLEHAQAGQITFLSNPRYRSRLETTHACAVVLAPESEGLTQLPRIVTDNPYAYFARVSRLFNPDPAIVPGVHADARVARDARVGASAHIGPGAVIGAGAVIGEGASIGAASYVGEGVVIGAGSRIHPSVVIYAGCRIGARAILHSGAVIGADGFGFAHEGDQWVKVPQIGRVILGEDVEVGANTTIDRGAVDDTVIEDGVKLDNQIQIGHNCHIGAHTAMAGCVGIAGSARIGRHCTLGGGAIVLGHLSIADHVHISAATVITRSIDKAGTYTGMYPFEENRSWARNAVLLRSLAGLANRVKALERRLSEKENRNG